MLTKAWSRGPGALAASALMGIVGAVAVVACAPSDNVLTSPVGPAGPDGTRPVLDADDLAVTPQQRAYLDALKAAGVQPSSALLALSIGSYICQAVDAGQSTQAVRDFILPMVRGEYSDSNPGVAVTSMTSEVRDTTDVYVRTATDELC